MDGLKVVIDTRCGDRKVVAFYDDYGNSVTYKEGAWHDPVPSEEVKTHLRSVASFLTRIAKAASKG